MVQEKQFDIDAAEDFDDGTRAVTAYDSNDDVGSGASDDDNARVSRRRKARSAGKSASSTRERASSLRVKNWDAADALDSAEYAGKVVKRALVSETPVEEEEKEDGGESSPDEDAVADWSDAEPFAASDHDDAGDDEEVEEEDNDISESDGEDEDADGADAETLIRGLEKEDSGQLMSVKDTAKLVEKANHVRHQKLLWERCLEVQIYTKRLLTTCKSVATQGNKEAATDDEQQRAAVVQQLYSCIDAVSELQDKLCNSEELTVAAASSSSSSLTAKKRKRSTTDELWTAIVASNQELLPQYNDILNASTRKTNLSGGNQAKKFKAVNQDILAQVESVLADPERVKRKAHAPADRRELADNGHTTAEEEDTDADLLDEWMYDDSDFYQQLLKEFIESGAGGSGTGPDTVIRRTHRKKKKTVDRKASKGRVVRYTVHPKLENFMFPEPYPAPEMDTDELFRSVFGQSRQA